MKTQESEYLTESQFRSLIRSVPNLPGYKAKIRQVKLTPTQFQLFFKVMYYCGLKVREMERLKKSDLDLGTGIIRIKSIAPTKYKPQQTTIPPIIINELQDHIKTLNHNDELFNTTRATVWRYIKQALDHNNIKISRSIGIKQVRGGDTFLFRDSLKHFMDLKKADKNLILLKLRDPVAPTDSETLERLRAWERENFPRPAFATTEIQSYVDWFTSERDFYEKLKDKSEQTVESVLRSEGFTNIAVRSRVKKITSFKKKLEDGFSYNPKEMQDLVGIRVIANVKTEVEEISKVIRKNFIVNETLSIDKSKELISSNKIGYQSKQFVVKFSDDRTKLTDFREYKSVQFEIQVRTILQHAWAEIEHPLYYKSNIKLPSYIERNFNLLSGTLELVDNQFEQIIAELSKYVEVNSQRKKIGEFNPTLNIDSLSGYLLAKFSDCPNIIRNFKIDDKYSNAIIIELRKMGIGTIDELESIFNSKLREAYIESKKRVDFVDVLRHMMIIYDAEKYFNSSWPKTFVSLDKETQKILVECGVDLNTVSRFLSLK